MKHNSVFIGTSVNIDGWQCDNNRCQCHAVVVLHFRLITTDPAWHVVNVTDVDSPRCADHVRPF